MTGHLIEAVEQENDISLKQALGLILGGIALRRGADGDLKTLTDRPDIESVLRVAQQLEARAAHPLAGYVANWSTALERIAPGGDGTVFRRLDERARQVMHDRLQTPDEPTKVKYLGGLRRLGTPWSAHENTSPFPQVFTLNYDRCVERALEYDQVPFTTGFDHGLWTPSVFEATDRIRLYKLHGSFGWVRHPETSLLYNRDEAIERADVEFMSDDTPDDLIFATESKLRALQPYLWMVYQFYEAVVAAQFVVVIGYRFGDEHINQVLGQALALEPTKRLLLVMPHFNSSVLEQAQGGLTYYSERTHHIASGARAALMDNDSVLSKIKDLMTATREETPF